MPFIREAMDGYSEEEVLQAQEQFSLFLNTLQEIHNELIAEEQNCDKVEDR
ncbi:MAG: hypothetical protein ACRBEE_12380 [Arenicella sp.]